MTVTLPAAAGTQLVAYVIVLARVGGLFMFAPIFSGRLIPARLKLVIAGALSLALMPIATAGKQVPSDGLVIAATIIKELGVGLAFALAVGAVGAGVQAGAGVLDSVIGFSFASIVDPLDNVQNAILGQLYTLFSVMVFVLVGGDHLMIRALSTSYRVVPLDHTPSFATFGMVALNGLMQMFVVGLEIAAPVLLALVVVDIAFAIVARAVPQMNVFIVGLPAKILVGFGVVAASLPFVANHLMGDLQHAAVQVLVVLGSR